MTLYGPDVSNNNFGSASAAVSFVSQLPGEGFSWVEQKVSEGNYYQDPYWKPIQSWCAANDFPCIGYHYVTTNDAASQAGTWRANGGGNYAMLDFEANSGNINNFWAVVNAFNAEGVTISISYIPRWYWQQIGSPDLTGVPGLVSSSYFGSGNYASVLYPGDDGAGWDAYGNVTPQIWQFTDGALVAGLSVDCNAFRGNLAQLTALLEGTSVTDSPTPDVASIVQDNQIQLRGPGLNGWPQLGGRTVVDALAAIGSHLGLPGFTTN